MASGELSGGEFFKNIAWIAGSLAVVAFLGSNLSLNLQPFDLELPN